MTDRPSAAELLSQPRAVVPLQPQAMPPPRPLVQQAMPPFSFDQARIALAGVLQRISGEISLLREIADRAVVAQHPNIAPFRQALHAGIGAADPLYVALGQALGCLRPAVDPKGRP